MSTAAACALKSQGLGGAAAAVTRPGSLPQHAGQSESGKTGGGRHPHPPSANNTKLKHKVSCLFLLLLCLLVVCCNE